MKIIENLKNCPFCGYYAALESDMQRQSEQHCIQCSNKKCSVFPITNFFETEEEAISTWNSRV